MMTWNEREAYKDIAQLCMQRKEHCLEVYNEIKDDKEIDRDSKIVVLEHRRGQIIAYEDIYNEIAKILGEN